MTIKSLNKEALKELEEKLVKTENAIRAYLNNPGDADPEALDSLVEDYHDEIAHLVHEANGAGALSAEFLSKSGWNDEWDWKEKELGNGYVTAMSIKEAYAKLLEEVQMVKHHLQFALQHDKPLEYPPVVSQS